MKDELNKYEEGYKLYILSGGQPVPAPVFYLDHIQDPQVGCHVNCKSCCIQHSDVIPLSDVVPYTSSTSYLKFVNCASSYGVRHGRLPLFVIQ